MSEEGNALPSAIPAGQQIEMSEEPSPAVSKNVSFGTSRSLSKRTSPSPSLKHDSSWLAEESSSYHPCQLHGEGVRRSRIPVVVRVRANVLRVVNVDLQGQCFTAVYRLEASWVAPELKLAADRLKREVGELIIDEQKSNQRIGKYYLADDLEDQPFFAPRLYLNNLVNLKPEENEEWFTVYEGAQGEAPIVCFRWKFKGTFQQVMELRPFPFDVQNLTIEINTGWEADHSQCGVLLVENLNARCVSLAPASRQSCQSLARTLTFTTARLSLSLRCAGPHRRAGPRRYTSNVVRPDKCFVQSSEYSLSKRLQIKTIFTPRSESASSHTYATLEVAMRVERHAGYWVFNVLLPLFIVTSSSFVSYTLSPDELSDRCSITLTTLLAMVAFKYVISGKLPSISYATLIDMYVMICFLAAFLIILLQALFNLEVANEPFFRFTINNNQTVTAAIDMAATDASLGTTTVWTHPAGPRTVKVSLYLVGLGGAWLAVHVLGFVCLSVLFMWRWQRNSFWGARATHVWLGPIHLPTKEGTEANSVARAEASKGLLAVMNAAAPGSAVSANVWWPDEARHNIMKALPHLKELPFAQRGCPTRPFAVISFTGEKGAQKAIDHATRHLNEASKRQSDAGEAGPLINETVPSHLNPSYYSALANHVTYQRRAGHAINHFFGRNISAAASSSPTPDATPEFPPRPPPLSRHSSA